ncbi:MAG TPA: hypothetical protein VLX58_13190 [Bryobacteraceae bacterium]|nr:hypothetical protein [Bryobacteraceae bacterium]
MNSSTGISVPVFDPFSYGVELPYERVLYPFGFRMQLTTNCHDVMRVAEENWSGFPLLFEDKSIELRMVVSDDQQAPSASGLIFRAQRHLLTLQSDRNNFAVCDLDKGFSFGWFVPATTRNHTFLRRYFLDTIVYVLLWQTHLTSIHAGCVARRGRAVLLCGESGAGKSCLSYACARRGWEFITDESSALLRRTKDRIVLGKPHQMHFRENAAAVLPELQSRLRPTNAPGEISIEVQTAGLPGIQTAFQSQAAATVFLNRGAGGPARLVPVTPEQACERLERSLPLFQPLVHEEHRASLRHLVQAGAYELRYGDLDEAVQLLESLVA